MTAAACSIAALDIGGGRNGALHGRQNDEIRQRAASVTPALQRRGAALAAAVMASALAAWLAAWQQLMAALRHHRSKRKRRLCGVARGGAPRTAVANGGASLWSRRQKLAGREISIGRGGRRVALGKNQTAKCSAWRSCGGWRIRRHGAREWRGMWRRMAGVAAAYGISANGVNRQRGGAGENVMRWHAVNVKRRSIMAGIRADGRRRGVIKRRRHGGGRVIISGEGGVSETIAVSAAAAQQWRRNGGGAGSAARQLRNGKSISVSGGVWRRGYRRKAGGGGSMAAASALFSSILWRRGSNGEKSARSGGKSLLNQNGIGGGVSWRKAVAASASSGESGGLA